MTALAASILVPQSKRLNNSENYLLAKHNLLTQFDGVENLVTSEGLLSEADKSGILHHLLNLRSAVARSLWTSGIYVGISVLDEFVLGVAKKGQPDICNAVIAELRQAGAETPGFVLYPLTEFGLEMPFSVSRAARSKLKPFAIFRNANFAIAAQANGFSQAFNNLTYMAKRLGINSTISRDDVAHHVRAGGMKWFANNPLMLIRLSSHTGDYYENQFLYTLKVRIAASLVVMLRAILHDAGQVVRDFDSTAFVNNWSTLDIRHYLIGENPKGTRLGVRRVPMNVTPIELARLSDLAVTLNSQSLQDRRIASLTARLVPLLKVVEDGYLKFVNLSTNSAVHSRVYRRLVTSLDWYRQSFGSRAREPEAIVALAVAFETLLTDAYANGVAERITRRLRICLKGRRGRGAYESSVLAIYYARSEIVHTGGIGHQTDLRKAQAAFALCFCDVASRLGNLTNSMANPMRELLGDVPA